MELFILGSLAALTIVTPLVILGSSYKAGMEDEEECHPANSTNSYTRIDQPRTQELIAARTMSMSPPSIFSPGRIFRGLAVHCNITSRRGFGRLSHEMLQDFVENCENPVPDGRPRMLHLIANFDDNGALRVAGNIAMRYHNINRKVINHEVGNEQSALELLREMLPVEILFYNSHGGFHSDITIGYDETLSNLVQTRSFTTEELNEEIINNFIIDETEDPGPIDSTTELITALINVNLLHQTGSDENSQPQFYLLRGFFALNSEQFIGLIRRREQGVSLTNDQLREVFNLLRSRWGAGLSPQIIISRSCFAGNGRDRAMSWANNNALAFPLSHVFGCTGGPNRYTNPTSDGVIHLLDWDGSRYNDCTYSTNADQFLPANIFRNNDQNIFENIDRILRAAPIEELLSVLRVVFAFQPIENQMLLLDMVEYSDLPPDGVGYRDYISEYRDAISDDDDTALQDNETEADERTNLTNERLINILTVAETSEYGQVRARAFSIRLELTPGDVFANEILEVRELYPNNAPLILETLSRIARSGSATARNNAYDFVQVFLNRYQLSLFHFSNEQILEMIDITMGLGIDLSREGSSPAQRPFGSSFPDFQQVAARHFLDEHRTQPEYVKAIFYSHLPEIRTMAYIFLLEAEGNPSTTEVLGWLLTRSMELSSTMDAEDGYYGMLCLPNWTRVPSVSEISPRLMQILRRLGQIGNMDAARSIGNIFPRGTLEDDPREGSFEQIQLSALQIIDDNFDDQETFVALDRTPQSPYVSVRRAALLILERRQIGADLAQRIRETR